MKKMDVINDVEKEVNGEHIEILIEHLKECKNITREEYKIVMTIYRGVRNGRFTSDWALEKLNNRKKR